MSPTAKPRILCLDDDPAIAVAIGARLKPLGVDVCSAFFGTQGIWLAVTQRPDVIISDIRMPNGGGHHVVECLKQRKDTRDIPIIVLTGLRDERSRRAMLALGVDHYLRKPLDFEALLDILSRYITLLEPSACTGLRDVTPVPVHDRDDRQRAKSLVPNADYR